MTVEPKVLMSRPGQTWGRGRWPKGCEAAGVGEGEWRPVLRFGRERASSGTRLLAGAQGTVLCGTVRTGDAVMVAVLCGK